MKYTQNAKILQITENTLIIGVDVASETHYARAFDYRGIEFGRLLRFSNDGSGFAAFEAWIGKLRAEQHKEHVMVGMEPTGHYWFTIAQHLKGHHIKIVLVNPFHVSGARNWMTTIPPRMTGRIPRP